MQLEKDLSYTQVFDYIGIAEKDIHTGSYKVLNKHF